jgi:large subunit ribosomal protein L18
MDRAKQRIIERKRRAKRVRKKIFGTTVRPRLSVRKSLKHIYAQIIDDEQSRSIVQLGSTSKDFRQQTTENATKVEVSRLVGGMIAEKAKECGIEKVVFDRKGYPFQGRIKALAEAAREKGLEF